MAFDYFRKICLLLVKYKQHFSVEELGFEI